MVQRIEIDQLRAMLVFDKETKNQRDAVEKPLEWWLDIECFSSRVSHAQCYVNLLEQIKEIPWWSIQLNICV